MKPSVNGIFVTFAGRDDLAFSYINIRLPLNASVEAAKQSPNDDEDTNTARNSR